MNIKRSANESSRNSIIGYKHSEVPKYFLGKENNKVVIRQVDYKPIKIL